MRLKLLKKGSNMANIQQFPLVYTLHHSVVGKGFIAKITMHGRVLAEDEGEDGWWINGVHPGGAVGGGPLLGDAMRDFCRRARLVLIDIAHEAATFPEFEAMARSFFEQVDDVTLDEWHRARKAARDGHLVLPELRAMHEIPDATIEVLLEAMTPDANAVPDTAEDCPALAA